MAYGCRVLADSVSPRGHRLTTLEVTLPRIILAELNTHRVFSRNSASSRAIPVWKQLLRIMKDPFIPELFGINQPGMQSARFHDLRHDECVEIWLELRDWSVSGVLKLLLGQKGYRRRFGRKGPLGQEVLQRWIAQHSEWLDDLTKGKLPEELFEDPLQEPLNVHKQLANRPLEPYMWHTVIITATEWSNFYALRADSNAQGEIRKAAEMMLAVYEESQPQPLEEGMWHLPLIQWEHADEASLLQEPGGIAKLLKVSTARCARISYLTHTGERALDADLMMHDRLVADGHMSPLEHPARVMSEEEFRRNPWSGNFFGWHQYRKDVPDEGDYGKIKERLAAEKEL